MSHIQFALICVALAIILFDSNSMVSQFMGCVLFIVAAGAMVVGLLAFI